MDILTVDMETFYSQDYSLGKLTTEEYIRHPDFEVIGVSVQVDNKVPVWFSGTMKQTKKFLDKYDWANSIAVAHNAMFDMAILNWHFDIRPKKIIDTLSMARPLHGTEVGGSLKALAAHYNLGEKGTEIIQAKGLRRLDFPAHQLAQYGNYCCNDSALTYALFGVLMAQYPVVERYEELDLIDMTIRMFTEPVLELDVEKLQTYGVSLSLKKQELLDSARVDKALLMSNPKFAELLRQLGVDPPMKISLRTGKETYAFAKTDDGFKALLEHENKHVQILATVRAGVKSTIEETRTQRFIDIASRGNLPVPLKYYAAHTGRWGGTDKINIQNLPSRKNKTLKECIIAPDGHKIIDCDSSQIEARTLAWLACQDDLVEAFENKEDVYKIMACSIYGKEIADITKEERALGKMVILACGYGMGHVKFRAQLKAMAQIDLPESECQHIINTYRETYKQIPELWRAANKILPAIVHDSFIEFGRNNILQVEGAKGIKLPNGLYLRYPNLRRGLDGYTYEIKRGRQTLETRIYGGKIIENVSQALAKIIIGTQLLKINKKYKVAMTVHDAGTSVVREEEVTTAREHIEMCMRMRPSWGMDLPLDCESGVGDSYGGCA